MTTLTPPASQCPSWCAGETEENQHLMPDFLGRLEDSLYSHERSTFLLGDESVTAIQSQWWDGSVALGDRAVRVCVNMSCTPAEARKLATALVVAANLIEDSAATVGGAE